MQTFISINILLRTAFATSHNFWYIVFPFSFVSRQFLISFLNFFFDLLVVQKYAVQFLHICKFSNFPLVFDS